jgi:hypothetical protein
MGRWFSPSTEKALLRVMQRSKHTLPNGRSGIELIYAIVDS